MSILEELFPGNISWPEEKAPSTWTHVWLFDLISSLWPSCPNQIWVLWFLDHSGRFSSMRLVSSRMCNLDWGPGLGGGGGVYFLAWSRSWEENEGKYWVLKSGGKFGQCSLGGVPAGIDLIHWHLVIKECSDCSGGDTNSHALLYQFTPGHSCGFEGIPKAAVDLHVLRTRSNVKHQIASTLVSCHGILSQFGA